MSYIQNSYLKPVTGRGVIVRESAFPQLWSGATGQLSFGTASDAVYNGHAIRWTTTGEAEVASVSGILPSNFVTLNRSVGGYFAFDFLAYKLGTDNNSDLQLLITVTVGGNQVSLGYTPLVAANLATAWGRRQRIDIGARLLAAGFSAKAGDRWEVSFALNEAAGNATVVVPLPHGALVWAVEESILTHNNAAL